MSFSTNDTKYLAWNTAGRGVLASAVVCCGKPGNTTGPGGRILSGIVSRQTIQMATDAGGKWVLVWRPAGMGVAPVSIGGEAGDLAAGKAAALEALPGFIRQVAPQFAHPVVGVQLGGGMIAL